MPNIVTNKLFVYGTQKDLREFNKIFTSKSDWWDYKPSKCESKEMIEQEKKTREAERISKDDYFSFNNIISVPKEIRKRRYDPYGHDWQRSNWGTKWDCFKCQIEKQPNLGRIIYSFQTAWDIPSPVIKTMANLFPECLFWLVYSQEFECSGYMTVFKRMRLDVRETFKIENLPPYYYSWCDFMNEKSGEKELPEEAIKQFKETCFLKEKEIERLSMIYRDQEKKWRRK